MVERGYIDVNVFVYWLGGHEQFGGRALEWIKRVELARPGEFVTSSLTLYELIVILAGLTNRSLRDREFVESVVSDVMSLRGLKIAPLTRDDVERAVKLMHDFNLDFEDALHLAVALREKVDFIVSNDTDFDRTPIRRVF